MKTSKHLFTFLILIFGIQVQYAQDCMAINDFESESIGPLPTAVQFGGYYAAQGTPTYTGEENCTPGGSQAIQLKASVDGSDGDVVGHTMSFGIVPPPTYFGGRDYLIQGKKLMSVFSMGDYSDINMTIALSNGNTNEAVVVSKALDLQPGVCVPWEPTTFTSPDDFDNLLISFSASSPNGADELFFVIDDWCIEEIEEECIAEIEVEQVNNCGEYKFHAIGSPNATAFDWVVTPTGGGAPITVTGNPGCVDFEVAGTYTVALTQTCDDGSIGETTLNLDVDFDTDPPVYEECPSMIIVPTEVVDGECMGTFEMPTPQVSDVSMIVINECYLDGLLVSPGTVISRPPGTYSLFCRAVDECENEGSCTTLYVIEPCDMPCDYECCEGAPNWPVEDLPLGSLVTMPDGYFAEFGDPRVVEDGCQGSLQSIELAGAGFLPGDGVSIRTSVGTGFIFEEGNTYCISYCVKAVGPGTPSPVLDIHATSDGQTDATCAGNCEIIGQSDVILPSQGWVEQQIIFAPAANQERLLFINNNNGVVDAPTSLRIDNVCITANPMPIECKADIVVMETDVCGKVIVDVETCGEVEELVITYDNGTGPQEVNDTTVCIEYASIGPWTVTINYFCADGTMRSASETFSLSSNPTVPSISCPQDTTIFTTSEQDCFGQYTLGAYTISDPSATVTCYVSGILVTDPTIPLSIPEGVAQIQYVASNECGADTCNYDVTVICDPVADKYACPIDVVFVMDNSGSIGDLEFQSMEASALQEITAISGVYTNSKFGVVHYSGPCGEQISIERDFSSASAITSMNRQFRNVYPGFNDNLDAALEATISAMYGGATDPDILAGTLTPTSGADLYVVIFTDGLPFSEASPGCANSQLQPYTQANILKNTYNANISVVHFVPGLADAECAAIASIGGTYTGTVDANPGDPTNPNGPRQYIPSPFGAPDINLLEILPACTPCFDCDSLVVTDKVVDEEACCYSIDIDNNIGPDIKKIEAQVINSDWQFNTTTTNPGLGFQYVPGSTPTASKVCITSSTGSIPTGTSTDILEYCFSPTVASPNPSQTVVIRWYSQMGDLYELECTDTLVTECEGIVDDPCLTGEVTEVACNPDNAYEYDVMVTITNNSGQAATHASFSGLPSGYQFAQAGSSAGSTIISVLIPGGLADGATTTLPLKIISPLPILSPQNVCFDLGLFSFMGECCHAPEQVCVVLDPCCDPCEDITTTFSSISVDDQEQCCFAFDIEYECDYLYFNKIKFTSTTTGVDFGYHAIYGTRFNMCGSTNKELCIEPVTTPLVRGSYSAALTVCMDGVTDPSQVPQLITVDYLTSNPISNEDTIACSDVLELECEPVDNECLEVTNQELECIPDSMKYRYTFQIKNTSSIPFSATSMTAFVIAPSDIQFAAPGSTFPFTPSLAPGDSVTITACLESTSAFPTSASDLILGYRLAHMAGDTCCYESVLDTIPFPPCDDQVCCTDEEEFNSLISLGFQVTDLGDCTYEVCANQFDTCHYFGTLGPDWGDGSVTLPNINQSNPPSNCWTHTYTTSGPHNICMAIYEGDPGQNDDCWNATMCMEIEHDCPVVIDTACFSVIDIEAKNTVCDTASCYDDPFCLPWLVSHLNSISCYGIGFAHADKAIYNGSPVFVVTSGYLDTSKDEIYDCAGNLLQSCVFTVPGSGGGGCMPDAGIDVSTDLSSVVRIYTCGVDPVPTYDPAVCSSGTDMSVDYCVKIMNNQAVGFADQIDLQGLMPTGMVITPSTVLTNIPAGGMATINFNVTGPLVANWNIKLKGIMRGFDDNENPTMCMDTIYLPVPLCPMDECCVDEDAFDANVLQGFQVTQLGSCTYEVCANQFDTCHYFGTLGPDWGDGSVTLPAVTQSNPPNNCWTYTYATSGTYVIRLSVYEGGSIDEVCWSGELEATVEPDCCTQDPCESVDLMTTSLSTTADSCCTLFSMNNAFCDDYFTGFVIDVAAPVSISQIGTRNGFILNQISSTRAQVLRQGGGFVPLGTLDVFSLCTTDYIASPHSVTVSWLVPVPGDEPNEVCPKDFDISCDIDFDPKCYEIVEDSIHCESMTYCLKIKNISQPGFDINSIHLYDFAGGALSPSGRQTIPTLTSGSTSDWICYQYDGAVAGDDICYKLSAHNVPAHLPPTQCCTDTIETCFEVPSCPVMSCGTCPDGASTGPNLIVNGDFEDPINPYFGWTSPYTIVPTGPMNTQDVSIRNSTNLSNTQWAAIDHTNGATLGNFLAIDGPWRNQVAYTTVVSVTPNTDYVFCMWVDNLVRTSTTSTPLLRIDIGGTTVEAGYPLAKTPDGWQLLTYNYNSGARSGAISIDVIDQDLISYSDWAIDDVSFAQCGVVVVDDCCDDLDEQAICDYYDANIFVDNLDCEGCVRVDADTCDQVTLVIDGMNISLMDNEQYCTDLVAGTHSFTILIERYNANGEICFEKAFDRVWDIDCPPVEGCCDDLDEQAICDYYDANIFVDNLDCEGCVRVDADTCDQVTLVIDGMNISLMDNEQYCTDLVAGTHSFTILIERYNANGEICFEKAFDRVWDIDCPPVGGCCDDLDEQAICDYYDANIFVDNLDCEGCVRVDADTCDQVTLVIDGMNIPLMDNEQYCTALPTGSHPFTIRIERYNANGEICFEKVFDRVWEIDCTPPPPSGTCLSLIEGNIDCASNSYCFRVVNRTSNPGFSFASIALVNESTGHSFNPDPISLGTPLSPGDTSAVICVAFAGAAQGDELCFDLVGHKEDLAMGQEPTFCCADTTRHCFINDCDTEPCCLMTEQEMCDYLAVGASANIDGCQMCLPFEEDSCMVTYIEFGDGQEWEASGGGQVCHTYDTPGEYAVSVVLERYGADGTICLEKDTSFMISVDCMSPPPPATCDATDLNIYNALTPNQDGLNDELVIDGGSDCTRNIRIFNRWGQLVWEELDYQNDWTGESFLGEQLPDGTYFLVIELPDVQDRDKSRIQSFIDIRNSK